MLSKQDLARGELLYSSCEPSARAQMRLEGAHGSPIILTDRTPGDAEALRDRGGTQLGPQSLDLRRVDADGAPFVFAGGLRLGDALALPLQHDLALPSRDAGQDRQHQLAGRVAGVQPLAAHGQDHQADAALRQVDLDGEQFGGAARQPVRLGDGQPITPKRSRWTPSVGQESG